MGTLNFVFQFAALLLLVVAAEPLARLLRLPASSILVVLGFLVGLVVEATNFDTGIRAHGFHDLVFYIFLPVLVFEAALQLDSLALRKNLGLILLLAIVGLLFTTVLAAAALFNGIGHSTGFPWIAALLTGAILAATDPVAVVAQLSNSTAPPRLAILLEGESLFNDATAVVLFSLLLSLASAGASTPDSLTALVEFGRVFFGGVAFGVVIAFLARSILRYLQGAETRFIFTLSLSLGIMLISEQLFHISGVMAVLTTALLLGHWLKASASAASLLSLHGGWQTLGAVANGVLFLLVGLTVTIAMFEERWLAMLIGVAAVLLARLISVVIIVSASNPFLSEKLPLRQQLVLCWGGLRGAVTLALALSLPTELPYWWTIQAIAFGVVLFTLLVQAPTTPALLRHLKL